MAAAKDAGADREWPYRRQDNSTASACLTVIITVNTIAPNLAIVSNMNNCPAPLAMESSIQSSPNLGYCKNKFNIHIIRQIELTKQSIANSHKNSESEKKFLGKFLGGNIRDLQGKKGLYKYNA